MPIKVLIRGAGDLASGVANRLHKSGGIILMTEITQPMVVRRGAAFAQAIFDGETSVEGVLAQKSEISQITGLISKGIIPIVIDEDNKSTEYFSPDVIVDARMLKTYQDYLIEDEPLVIGLGPGFMVGDNCHAIVETQRGHNLGKVIWSGEAAPNTSIPGVVAGKKEERVLRAPSIGVFESLKDIGDLVTANEEIARVGGKRMLAPFDGVIRGMLHRGIQVNLGTKVGDIDPRPVVENCFTISDKARAIGGGVLEAIMSNSQLRNKFS